MACGARGGERRLESDVLAVRGVWVREEALVAERGEDGGAVGAGAGEGAVDGHVRVHFHEHDEGVEDEEAGLDPGPLSGACVSSS